MLRDAPRWAGTETACAPLLARRGRGCVTSSRGRAPRLRAGDGEPAEAGEAGGGVSRRRPGGHRVAQRTRCARPCAAACLSALPAFTTRLAPRASPETAEARRAAELRALEATAAARRWTTWRAWTRTGLARRGALGARARRGADAHGARPGARDPRPPTTWDTHESGAGDAGRAGERPAARGHGASARAPGDEERERRAWPSRAGARARGGGGGLGEAHRTTDVTWRSRRSREGRRPFIERS